MHTIEIIETLLPVKGQIIIAAEVMHIISNAGLVSAETLAKQALTHDVRQCDTSEREADEARKAVHTWRVYFQWPVSDVEQISSGRYRCDQ